MADIQNTIGKKKYMSDFSLVKYDAKIKAKIESSDASTLESAKSYTDTELSGFAGEVDEALGNVTSVLNEHGELIGSKTNQSDFITLQATVDGKAEKEHIHSNATTSKSGMLSSTDKEKLDNVEPNATNNKITIVRW